MYINTPTLREAVKRMQGTAGHLLKIWLTLKHMGLKAGKSTGVSIDTSNSTDSLKRLFGYGSPDEDFYIPFAHTQRYLTMKSDASRSIIQTNVQRWATSGSVVTCDPTSFLDFDIESDGKVMVSTGKRYPLGLGYGESGFALKSPHGRVQVPLTAFATWYGRQTRIEDKNDPLGYLVALMIKELNLDPAEITAVFTNDSSPFLIETQQTPLSDIQVYEVCRPFISNEKRLDISQKIEDFATYEKSIKRMAPDINTPELLRYDPEEEVRCLIKAKANCILLYGPPRTGKTRFLDSVIPRNSSERETIQIHDGWSYDNLVEGFRPDENGKWKWHDGPLKLAIETGKKLIILEEVNRTALSQSLGEVFSLIETKYRGVENSIRLRSGKLFHIPNETIIIMTMNSVDKSTEDIDDALLGRVHAVEFPASTRLLINMLIEKGFAEDKRDLLVDLHGLICKSYQLGHGYFADIDVNSSNEEIRRHYRTRIRPVLNNFFGKLRQSDLLEIDGFVENMIKLGQ